jgi:hypothetical protein
MRQTAMRSRKTPKARPAPEQPDDADATIEQQRAALVDKITAFAADWRRCPRPACRRHRTCRSAAAGCGGLSAPRPMTEEQWAREAARLKRALERRLEEMGDECAAAPISVPRARRPRPAPACRGSAPGTAP